MCYACTQITRLRSMAINRSPPRVRASWACISSSILRITSLSRRPLPPPSLRYLLAALAFSITSLTVARRKMESIKPHDGTVSREYLLVIIYQVLISVLFPALNDYRTIKESACCDKRLYSFIYRPAWPKASKGKVTK